jgi:ABC-2 type transport system permease protein
MIADLRTVVWKEWRSLIGGRARRQLLIVGVLLAFQAILFPFQMGRDWVNDPVGVGILGIIMPMVVVGVVIPDAIAGERERHTLTTLLASRLPDRAILFGKLVFAVVAGWLVAPILLAIALLAVNTGAAESGFVMYDPAMLGGILAAGLLVALLTGGIGVFVSLRARTAQEAQQLTLAGLLTPIMVGGAILLAVVSNPDLGPPVLDMLSTIDGRALAAGALAILALVDAGLVWAADRRFRRGRLSGG